MDHLGPDVEHRCYCEEGELCSRCHPLALLQPRGSDGVVEVSELYGRSLDECSCVVGELCRFCRPQLALLVEARLVELVSGPSRSEPLWGLQTPIQRLQALANDN